MLKTMNSQTKHRLPDPTIDETFLAELDSLGRFTIPSLPFSEIEP